MSTQPEFLTAQEWARLKRLFRLSPREAEIVGYILGGRQDARIAVECGISMDTVRTHVRRIYAKIDVNSRVQLVTRVFEAYVTMKMDLNEQAGG